MIAPPLLIRSVVIANSRIIRKLSPLFNQISVGALDVDGAVFRDKRLLSYD